MKKLRHCHPMYNHWIAVRPNVHYSERLLCRRSTNLNPIPNLTNPKPNPTNPSPNSNRNFRNA